MHVVRAFSGQLPSTWHWCEFSDSVNSQWVADEDWRRFLSSRLRPPGCEGTSAVSQWRMQRLWLRCFDHGVSTDRSTRSTPSSKGPFAMHRGAVLTLFPARYTSAVVEIWNESDDLKTCLPLHAVSLLMI